MHLCGVLSCVRAYLCVGRGQVQWAGAVARRQCDSTVRQELKRAAEVAGAACGVQGRPTVVQ